MASFGFINTLCKPVKIPPKNPIRSEIDNPYTTSDPSGLTYNGIAVGTTIVVHSGKRYALKVPSIPPLKETIMDSVKIRTKIPQRENPKTRITPISVVLSRIDIAMQFATSKKVEITAIHPISLNAISITFILLTILYMKLFCVIVVTSTG